MTAQESSLPSSRTVRLRDTGLYAVAFMSLAAFFILTVPANHSLSRDAYMLGWIIRDGSVTVVEHPRLFLFIVAMQAYYAAADLVLPDPDLFHLVAVANAATAALAIVLLVRLQAVALGVSRVAAWLSAGMMAATYGFWRYSAEIEVYASSVLICVALLSAAFALARSAPDRVPAFTIALAFAGALGTLWYQPIGFLAGVAIPFFILIAMGLRTALIYGLISGAIVAGGMLLAGSLAPEGSTYEGMAFVLDAKAVSIRVPDLLTPPKMLHGLGSMVLSSYWLLAFEPVQELFARIAPRRSYDLEIFAAERAGAIVYAAFATMAVSLVLLARLVFLAVRERTQPSVTLREVTIWVWLFAHAAMVAFLGHGVTEPWILAFPAIFSIAALRVIEPVVASGRTWAVASVIVAFLVHNAVGGLGVQMRKDGDYLVVRGEDLLEQVPPGDLVVLASDWWFQDYLVYSGMRNSLEIRDTGIEVARAAVRDALASGSSVWFLDDVVDPPETLWLENRSLAAEVASLADTYVNSATRRLPLADGDWIYHIAPKVAKE